MPEKITSFFSRFTMKLIEIIGAGIATAFGGYLVAHLGAYLSTAAPETTGTSTTPAAVVTAPNAAVTTRAPRWPQGQAHAIPEDSTQTPAAAPADGAAPSVKEAVAPPAPAPRVPPKAAEAGAEGKGGGPREATSSRKAGKAEAAAESKAREAEAKPRAAESKAREVDAKPRDAEGRARDGEAKLRDAESKPRDMETVEAEVRAALAKVDAGRPAVPQVPYQAPVPPAPTQPAMVAVPPKSAEASAGSAGAVAATAPATTALTAPQALQSPSMPRTPVEPAPLDTVEIKPQPVVADPVDAVPPAATAEATPPTASAGGHEDGGLFSAIKKIPDILRPGAGATTKEPPRPPMPVGDSQ